MDLTIAPLTVQEAEIMNKAAFQTEIAAITERYAGLVVMDKTEAKKDRAEINRILKQIDDARKTVKRQYEVPLKVFEAELKELTAPLKIAGAEIDEQIKLIEAQEREGRRKEIEALYATIPTSIPLSAVWTDKWLNASVSMKRVKEELMQNIIEMQSLSSPAATTPIMDEQYPSRNDARPLVGKNAAGVPVYNFTGDDEITKRYSITATAKDFELLEATFEAMKIIYIEV